MSMAERRAFLAVVLEVGNETRTSQLITLGLDVLANAAGGQAGSPGDLVAMLARIGSRPVRLVDDVTGAQVDTSLMGVRWRPGDMNLEIEVPALLIPPLLAMKSRYTAAELEARMGLGGGQARRLYELLRSRLRAIGEQVTQGRIEIGIAELQRELGAGGRYVGRLDNFRQRVLDRVCARISKETDLKATYWVAGEVGDKRRATAVVFEVAVRQDMASEDTELAKRLMEAGLSRADAVQMIDLFGASDRGRIVWHLDELERKLKRGEIRSSPAGWLKVAVREDYRPRPSALEQTITVARRTREAQYQKERSRAAAESEATAARDAEVKAAIRRVVTSLPAVERKLWAQEVADELRSDHFRQSWKRQEDFIAPMFRREVAMVIERHTGIDVRTGQGLSGR